VTPPVPRKRGQLKRKRYQHGSLTIERRANVDVWIYRWRETNTLGKSVHRKITVGTLRDYPTQSDAQRQIVAVRVQVNDPTQVQAICMTVAELTAHFIRFELDSDLDNSHRTFATKGCYRSYLRNWIVPRWGELQIRQVRTVAVEEWLRQLPLTNGTKAKIRNHMSALFSHAIRYEWLKTNENPIRMVRQSAKREKIPEVLDIDELSLLLDKVESLERVLILLCAFTGLRASELLALKWCDIDFNSRQLNVTRSIVQQRVGRGKTEASRKPVPLDEYLIEDLNRWRAQTAYGGDQDWIFASSTMGGKQPLWPERLRDRIQSAANRAGIKKRVGFHTFRHSLSTILKANGEDIKTVQELLRHSTSRVTLDTYTQAVTPAKRQAQSKVIQLVLNRQRVTEDEALGNTVPYCSQAQ